MISPETLLGLNLVSDLWSWNLHFSNFMDTLSVQLCSLFFDWKTQVSSDYYR